ncbi:hypothetical protein JM18_008095 [Phytophthora kernoviae]|uniref:Uncharacterized protein n=1 Tax=Phytophthora kernoviae TaxID=325452 RepID=A0A921SBG7_9STRA|nr:hypothetical protein JM18_008095 [Phytophthora kernoviae]
MCSKQEGASSKSAQPDSGLVAGVGAGAIVGVAATTATVPAVQAAGFTSTGIAGNSIAAGMMSNAAAAEGGGVSAGSIVAVLQGVGAAGAVPLGIAAVTVGGAAAVGLGIAGIVKSTNSVFHESLSAYDPRDTTERCWIIAIEKGPGNVCVCRYGKESDAREAFGRSWNCRLLYDPDGNEIASAGWNHWARAAVRKVMTEKYFTR